MKAREMTYIELLRWKNKVDHLKNTGTFTKANWCEIGNQLKTEHGLSDRVAIRIMQGNFEEAVVIELAEEEECKVND